MYANTKQNPCRKLRFKLCPELGDGASWHIVSTKDELLAAIDAWCDEQSADSDASEIRVETCFMTDEEVESLPDV